MLTRQEVEQIVNAAINRLNNVPLGLGGLRAIGTGSNQAAPGSTVASMQTADVLVKTATTAFSAERVVTDTATVTADWSTAGQVKFNASAGAGSPLTTKGDLYGYSTTNARIPVGTNGDVLTADSTQTLGVKWAAPSSGTPSSSVVTETAYGQASAAGSATTYSRGDHTHGTPALPTAAAIGAATLAGVAGGQTLLGDTVSGGTLTLRGSSAGGKVNVPDALGLRAANRPVVSFPFQQIIPVATGQVGVGTGLANTATGTDSSDSTGLWQRVSGASAGLVNIRATPMLPAPGTVEFLIRTGSDITNQRIYLLLCPANGAAGDTQPNDSVGLAYRHAVDPSNWEAVSRDGTTSATPVDIAPIAANTVYACRIRYDGTSYYMSVNDSAEVTMSTNLPTVATGMCICTSNSAGTHYLYWGVMARFFNWPA